MIKLKLSELIHFVFIVIWAFDSTDAVVNNQRD